MARGNPNYSRLQTTTLPNFGKRGRRRKKK